MSLGHVQAMCPETKKELLTQCIACQKRGHLDLTCPELKKGQAFWGKKKATESLGEAHEGSALCLNCGVRGHVNCATSDHAKEALTLDPLLIVS